MTRLYWLRSLSQFRIWTRCPADRQRGIQEVRAFLLLSLVGLTACSDPAPVVHDEAPARLSQWQLFSLTSEELAPLNDTLVFRPASTLFTDYAQKLRTLWIPEGMQAAIVAGEIRYPVGTVLSKTFYYPRSARGNVAKLTDQRAESISLRENRIMETRLLVRRSNDWEALPYIWNEEQTEAFLRVAGSSSALTLSTSGESEDNAVDFTYFVPNQNQCSGCHQTEPPNGELQPLGARLEQLASNFHAGAGVSQLQAIQDRGWLDHLPTQQPPVDWSDENEELGDRALAYLNMNCGHCHNPQGPADTSALILDGSHNSFTELGVCKPPVAAGGGAGSLRYGIVPGDADSSILAYRMRSQAPDEMMPELGRALIHEEGLDLVSNWIDELDLSPCSN